MSGNDIEGFICPYCLVSFGTSGKLQNHFVDMHSGQGVVDDYDVIDYVEDEVSVIELRIYILRSLSIRFINLNQLKSIEDPLILA